MQLFPIQSRLQKERRSRGQWRGLTEMRIGSHLKAGQKREKGRLTKIPPESTLRTRPPTSQLKHTAGSSYAMHRQLKWPLNVVICLCLSEINAKTAHFPLYY